MMTRNHIMRKLEREVFNYVLFINQVNKVYSNHLMSWKLQMRSPPGEPPISLFVKINFDAVIKEEKTYIVAIGRNSMTISTLVNLSTQHSPRYFLKFQCCEKKLKSLLYKNLKMTLFSPDCRLRRKVTFLTFAFGHPWVLHLVQ